MIEIVQMSKRNAHTEEKKTVERVSMGENI